ncbi:hypothetical protein Cgig2_026333 [Carnegiea gigantea]|uniref:LIM zinc-binding domain-containing protein n=1 Tax=Carnegiea gigantea TaxID=171969 RepID=A0A9Q1KE08_9CARY|nr:hypothetical protein Cgig2_026333 [Carnegiea gigantea]
MAFTGTLDKCKACDKTVYFVDLLTADGVTYHKTCFRCIHCKGTLVMSNYSSMDGVLYCKPHFEQLFKESGDFRRNFQNGLSSDPHLASSTYINSTMEGESYHKSCFKCALGGCPLTHSSYAALDGILYCRNHFQQKFMEKGNLAHVKNAARKNAASTESQESPETSPKVAPESIESESNSEEAPVENQS